MEGDDETMSTITATNDKEHCSAAVLKTLKSILGCVFMKKDNFNNTWICGHCNITYSKINNDTLHDAIQVEDVIEDTNDDDASIYVEPINNESVAPVGQEDGATGVTIKHEGVLHAQY